MTVPPVVNSTIGGDVVLPCSFTHPKQQDYSKGITVQWVTRQFHDKPFFQCKVKNVTTGGMNECSVPESYQRFSVKGDPKQRDLSLLIRDLAVTDNGVYFCRVELDYYWGDGKWQTASGTQLNIIGKGLTTLSAIRVWWSRNMKLFTTMIVMQGLCFVPS
jgi:hypothetical protein